MCFINIFYFLFINVVHNIREIGRACQLYVKLLSFSPLQKSRLLVGRSLLVSCYCIQVILNIGPTFIVLSLSNKQQIGKEDLCIFGIKGKHHSKDRSIEYVQRLHSFLNLFQNVHNFAMFISHMFNFLTNLLKKLRVNRLLLSVIKKFLNNFKKRKKF